MKLTDFMKRLRAVYALDMATARRHGLFQTDAEWTTHRRDPFRWLLRAEPALQEKFWNVIEAVGHAR
jgi:hypothetical protein